MGYKNGIREGYYALYVAMNQHRVLSDDDMPKMSSPRHIRHCIELLRQVLMCQPDLTLEVKNLFVGGVAGFGTEHQCRDWKQLMSFTKEWETWGLIMLARAKLFLFFLHASGFLEIPVDRQTAEFYSIINAILRYWSGP
jgi:hypothetical protein